MNMPFTGAKLAILYAGAVVTILRDDIAGIPYRGYWDFPGGGREGDETPTACALRETREELGLCLEMHEICWGRLYGTGAARVWFFVHRATDDRSSRVRLGDEGQTWCLMPVEEFLNHSRAVPHFKHRLRQYLEQCASH